MFCKAVPAQELLYVFVESERGRCEILKPYIIINEYETNLITHPTTSKDIELTLCELSKYILIPFHLKGRCLKKPSVLWDYASSKLLQLVLPASTVVGENTNNGEMEYKLVSTAFRGQTNLYWRGKPFAPKIIRLFGESSADG